MDQPPAPGPRPRCWPGTRRRRAFVLALPRGARARAQTAGCLTGSRLRVPGRPGPAAGRGNLAAAAHATPAARRLGLAALLAWSPSSESGPRRVWDGGRGGEASQAGGGRRAAGWRLGSRSSFRLRRVLVGTSRRSGRLGSRLARAGRAWTAEGVCVCAFVCGWVGAYVRVRVRTSQYTRACVTHFVSVTRRGRRAAAASPSLGPGVSGARACAIRIRPAARTRFRVPLNAPPLAPLWRAAGGRAGR